jgi:hypothetical protein
MTNYPLTRRALQAGVVAGAAAALVSNDQLIGYSVFVLCAAVGLTWRENEAPVFPFILLLQWTQVTSGYYFWRLTGELPSVYPPGDLDRAITLALTGLLTLALGIRVVGQMRRRHALEESRHVVGNLTGLFWLVIFLYSANYLSILNTKTFSGYDVILERILLMRQIPLLLLWFEVLRQQRHKIYLWLSLAWVFVPALGSYFSDFKTPLLLALIVSAAAWKPWEGGWWRFSFRGAARSIGIVAAALFLTLTWQAGVKRDARKAYDSNAVGSSPLERVELFLTSATSAVPVVFEDTQNVVEGLVSRVWYVVFFSRVLEHVPAIEPHADGELLGMAVTNTVMPRFLFPNKPLLPSDSYYTRRFAGINVAEDTTSISIGYMAEFYADWGVGGMFMSVFLYGVLMGGAAWLVAARVKSPLLVNPALMTVLLTVSFFEHQFIKTVAALTIAVVITIAVIALCRRRFERFLELQELPEAEEPAAEGAPGDPGGGRPTRLRLPAQKAAL